MSFAVVVDSTADLNMDEYRSNGITMVPLTIQVGGKEYKDQTEISSEEFYDLMAASDELPKTAAPAPYDFVQTYKTLAQQGYDHIISLHIASVLSGTVESARLAARQIDVPVTVIDTLGGGASLGILALKACELRDADISIDKACSCIKEYIADFRFLIACDSLENLLKGGRLSADQVRNASLLNIKPLFTFDERGVLVSYGRAKGMNGVVKKYVKEIQERTESYGLQEVRFYHTRNREVVNEVRARLQAAGIEYIDKGDGACGATVATHIGLGAVGIASLTHRLGELKR